MSVSAPKASESNLVNDILRAMGLSIAGAALVAVSLLVDGTDGRGPGTAALRLLGLAAASWPGLVAIGRMADVYLATVEPARRAAILEDRYVGSFGTVAIMLSLLVELVAALTAPSARLVPLPIAAALAGSTVAVIALRSRLTIIRVIATGIAVGAQMLAWRSLGVTDEAAAGMALVAPIAALVSAVIKLPSSLLLPFSAQMILLMALIFVSI